MYSCLAVLNVCSSLSCMHKVTNAFFCKSIRLPKFWLKYSLYKKWRISTYKPSRGRTRTNGKIICAELWPSWPFEFAWGCMVLFFVKMIILIKNVIKLCKFVLTCVKFCKLVYSQEFWKRLSISQTEFRPPDFSWLQDILHKVSYMMLKSHIFNSEIKWDGGIPETYFSAPLWFKKLMYIARCRHF